MFCEISRDFIGRFWEDVSYPVYLGVCHTEKILILNLTAEAVDSSMRTVMIGTGIPTACALMTLFWKDMRVQSLKGSIKQKHQQIMDGFGWIWGGALFWERHPQQKLTRQVFRVGPGDFRLDKKWDVKKTTCTRVLPPSVPDSSGEIHIDYHRFTDRATSFNTSLNGFRTQQNFAADNRSKKNSKKSRLERSQVSVKCASIFHQYSMNVPSIFYQYSINVLSIFHHFPSIFHQFQGYES